jgi:integrase
VTTALPVPTSSAVADDPTEIVVGELVDETIASLLAGRRIISPRTASMMPLPEVDPETLAKLGVHVLHSFELSRRALAANTQRNYEAAWQAFCEWCEERGVAALPAEPVVVGAYLTSLALAYNEAGEVLFTDESKPQRGKLRPQSMGVHLTAINRYHVSNRFPRPSDDRYVANVVRGIRRTFGVHKDCRKAAIDRAKLERIVQEIRAVEPGVTRDRALALLASRPAAGAGVLARLTCGRVELTRREAIVRLPSPHKGTSGEVELVFAATGDPVTCPVELLAAQLRQLAGENGVLAPDTPLLAVPRTVTTVAEDGTEAMTVERRALTKQGVAKAVRRLADLAGRTHLAGLSDVELRQVLLALAAPTLGQLRDEAVLATGWITAMRRSNLTYLRWRHFVTVDEDGFVADLEWSKTNQDGEEEDTLVSIPVSDDPTDVINPGRALHAWRAAVAGVVGGPPERVIPDWPVFTPVDRHNNIDRVRGRDRFQSLSGEAINALVQQYVARIGLDPRKYGAHSLRIGVITELVRMGFPIPEIQKISKHKSVQVLLGYAQAEDRRVNDPARRLLSRRVSAAG